MSRIAKALAAAAVLACAPARAEDAAPTTGQWLKAGDCSLFNADAHPGDTVTWTGACENGFASGLGTATFTGTDGKAQSFTAEFVKGEIPDGPLVARWGQGWSYEGETVGGHFNGAGILTTDTADRFEGQWSNGKLNGFGTLRRANGERYVGEWKDDKPNGNGELHRADGTLLAGNFIDGKFTQADAPKLEKAAVVAPVSGEHAPFSTVSGKTLTAVDGSSIALNLIEGGMELQVSPGDTGAAAAARKTTFTFMTDRMGTVVEDSGQPGAGTSVTGFFRLTGKGVEVRYADGRSAMLSANGDGGVQMALDGDAGPSCRNWYPAGHAFTDLDKKAALNAYASRLGLPVAANDTNACGGAPVAAVIAPPAAEAAPAPAGAKPAKLSRTEVKVPARMAKASYHIGDYAKSLEAVAVKSSEVHAIDEDTPAISGPSVRETVAAVTPTKTADKSDASKCLKVDSDGNHWGFRNGCDYAVQFSYCMAGESDSLAACGKDVTTALSGSVAANGFGALSADTSIKEKDGAHNFRWIACGGGVGEVVAHLDHAEPPSGRCERAKTASNN